MCGGRSPGDIDVVVVPLEETSSIEIERLLCRVSRNACGERDFQAPPGLSAFLPRLDFFCLHTAQGKEKRRIQIGPHRVSGEVRQLQAVPPGVEHVSLERLAGIESFLHDAAVARFDGDAVGLKGRVSIRLPERPM
jgi:hypothetical protein